MKALYARLKREGVDVWLDKEKLLPGADWELEIRKAVREADVVVVCLSKQFNQAGFRQKEVRIALDAAMEKPEGEIFIIPARLEECDNLESLSRWHWVDLFESDGFQRLILALRVRAEKIGATLRQHGDMPPYPVRKSTRNRKRRKSAAEKVRSRRSRKAKDCRETQQADREKAEKKLPKKHVWKPKNWKSKGLPKNRQTAKPPKRLLARRQKETLPKKRAWKPKNGKAEDPQKKTAERLKSREKTEQEPMRKPA